MAQHKWHKEIKAWADGAEIEMRRLESWGWRDWETYKDFYWYEGDVHEYRIKPQPTHEEIMEEHYRETAKKALAIPEISDAVDRLFEAFAVKEPQYLYAYDLIGQGEVYLYDCKQDEDTGIKYIGKIKLEVEDV